MDKQQELEMHKLVASADIIDAYEKDGTTGVMIAFKGGVDPQSQLFWAAEGALTLGLSNVLLGTNNLEVEGSGVASGTTRDDGTMLFRPVDQNFTRAAFEEALKEVKNFHEAHGIALEVGEAMKNRDPNQMGVPAGKMSEQGSWQEL